VQSKRSGTAEEQQRSRAWANELKARSQDITKLKCKGIKIILRR